MGEMVRTCDKCGLVYYMGLGRLPHECAEWTKGKHEERIETMMNDDVRQAQVEAGERAVIERLRAKGLLPPPEPPAPDAGERWELSKPLTNQILRNDIGGSYLITGIDVITEDRNHFGKIVVFNDPDSVTAKTIVNNHRLAALVPQLKEALNLARGVVAASCPDLLPRLDAALRAADKH